MNFLATGLYVPIHRAVGGSADWKVIVALIVVMAIALTAVLVYANRSVKTLPTRESKPADDATRKAA
jgi:predicted MFS family arabinose efflux permease